MKDPVELGWARFGALARCWSSLSCLCWWCTPRFPPPARRLLWPSDLRGFLDGTFGSASVTNLSDTTEYWWITREDWNGPPGTGFDLPLAPLSFASCVIVIGGDCCQEREKVALDDHAKVALNDIATGNWQKAPKWGHAEMGNGVLGKMRDVPKTSSRNKVINFNGQFDDQPKWYGHLKETASVFPCDLCMELPCSQAGTSFPRAGVRTPVMCRWCRWI